MDTNRIIYLQIKGIIDDLPEDALKRMKELLNKFDLLNLEYNDLFPLAIAFIGAKGAMESDNL